MQIHVIEGIAGDRFEDQRQRRMSGKTHRTHPSCGLPAPHHIQTAAGAQGLLQMLRQVHTVNGQQIHPLHRQAFQAQGQLRFKDRRILLRGHFGLQDALRIRQLRQQPTELPLRAAVMTRRFQMMQSARHSALQSGAHLLLAFSADGLSRKVAPALLKAHAAERQKRHRQLGAAETAGGQHQG